MGKVYGVLDWEYRKPVRAPPACRYKPAANKRNINSTVVADPDPDASEPVLKSVVVVDDSKLD